MDRLRSFFVKPINDCYICAFRILFFLGMGYTYVSVPQCPHFTPVKYPRFNNSRIVFAYGILLSCTFVAGIASNMRSVLKGDSPTELLLEQLMRAAKSLNTLCFQFSVCVNSEKCEAYLNNLTRLINRRRLFEIDSVLTRREMRFYQMVCVAILGVTVVHTALFCWYAWPSGLDFGEVLDFLCVIMFQFGYVNITSYIASNLRVYHVCMQVCLRRMKEVRELLGCKDVVHEIRCLHRFYLRTCLNYNKHVVAVGSLVYFVEQVLFAIVLFVATYMYINLSVVKHTRLKFDNISDVFTVGFTVMMFCLGANAVTTLMFVIHVITLFQNLELLSVLNKFPTSKLSEVETSQVEMFITTLTLKKPELRASDIFTVGTDLLSSIAGNVVTYVLVALQFHASFSK